MGNVKVLPEGMFSNDIFYGDIQIQSDFIVLCFMGIQWELNQSRIEWEDVMAYNPSNSHVWTLYVCLQAKQHE